jgi:hypothetical protein
LDPGRDTQWCVAEPWRPELEHVIPWTLCPAHGSVFKRSSLGLKGQTIDSKDRTFLGSSPEGKVLPHGHATTCLTTVGAPSSLYDNFSRCCSFYLELDRTHRRKNAQGETRESSRELTPVQNPPKPIFALGFLRWPGLLISFNIVFGTDSPSYRTCSPWRISASLTRRCAF